MLKLFVRVFVVAALALDLGAVISQVAVRPAYADDAGKCCTGTEDKNCSGCIALPAGAGFVKVGTNTTYFCEDYVNPLTCDDQQFLECWSITAPVAIWNAGCKNVIGVQNPPATLTAKQCPQDSCD
jgi:hypothetical protein